MSDKCTIIVFKDGYQSPTRIRNNRFNKNVFLIEAQMIGHPVGYFVNVKLKENRS